MSTTRRICQGITCRGQDLEGIWWSYARNVKLKDLGVFKDQADFVFRCRKCGGTWSPAHCLADGSRQIAFSGVTTLTQGAKGVSAKYPGFFIEAWNEHGWWYAEGLGFGIRSKGNVLDQVANDVRKKVHARVVAHYRFKTGVDWTFGDPDDFLDLEFTLGVDPSPDDFAP